MYLYHITKASNLASIKLSGLKPSIGDNSKAYGEKHAAIYFFKDEVSAEDALVNWFGDTLDDDEKVILLKIRDDFMTFPSAAEFEVFTKDIISFCKVEEVKYLL